VSYNTKTGLTFDNLRSANRERVKHSKFAKCESEWTLAHWMQATVGELGELANIMKKVDRGDLTLDAARESMAKEFADVQTYLDIMADKAGVDLGDATINKFNEVSQRIGSRIRLDADDWYYAPSEGAQPAIKEQSCKS
jgi:NTP pyrophosphatase (non-canonical NTP hydrolase)